MEEKILKQEEEPKKQKRKWKISKEKGKKIGFVAAIVLVSFFLLWGIGRFLFRDKRIPYEDFKKTDAFFLSNEEGLYALFQESGEQLTDYLFSSTDTFYGGVTRVQNEKGEYALLNQRGKFLLNFSDRYLYRYYSLYKIAGDEGKKDILLNYRGKQTLEEKVISVNNFSSYALYLVQILGDVEKKRVRVYDYTGKKIDTLDADNYSISEEVIHGYVTLSTAEKTILYNVNEGKKVTTLEGKYCVSNATEDTVLLSSCAYFNEEDQDRNYKVVKDGKERYTLEKDTCQATLTDKGEIVCKGTDSFYRFVDSKGKIGKEKATAYLDSKNYVVIEDNNATFYEKGKKKKTASCLAYSATTEDGYIMQSYPYGECKNEKTGYFYYNKKGEKKSERYLSATIFDENGLAIVSKESGSYYLINRDFKKVSNEYSRIRAVNGFYLVYRDDKYQLIDKKEKVLEEGIKDYTTSVALKSEEAFIGLIKDDEVVVYNMTKKKKVGEAKGTSIVLMNHYYVVGKEYYSYLNGKSFYTAK